ncbi:Nitrogen regulation protein NR(II) [Pseudidiomarina piscicola]|uniref:Sensory histidine kinase/phosphatase NtrB n=1 Tax=Pseudidiomarina piscicola TaxID=2614830 RepID=A0A6S6WQP8_9GAMM|nr:nitrogen regulation protein NR(II) [Pseudidiomarina piscicola]CAB0151403.1 Nitrogen regulation protein NR(II) [Pseudidiomarina piscicola]VZT40883.1 Nitrogen regulation protein NR(II) [Pseudomonas aeruginosa]
MARTDCTNMVQPDWDQLLTGIVQLNEQLHICYMNAAAETLLDGSRKRLLGTPLFGLFRFSSLAPEVVRQALRDKQSVSDSDVTWVFHDGQRVTVEFIAQPLRQNDGHQHVLLELRRVDQIRRINQENSQQQQLQAAHSMVRGLAHEIKNPLGGLRGAAQLLAGELGERPLLEYTDLIISQADRLRNLVDRMLGSHELPARAPTNVHEVIERVIAIAQLSAASGIQFERDYDPSLPELTVAADSIEQALLNVVMNAVEALTEAGRTEDGHVTVRTRVKHQQTLYGLRYRRCAVIEVQDNGPGVPEPLKETLFYPMVSGRAGGTGLGLAITQNAVHQHAGKIELLSEPHTTRFRLYLPYIETRFDSSGRVAGSD